MTHIIFAIKIRKKLSCWVLELTTIVFWNAATFVIRSHVYNIHGSQEREAHEYEIPKLEASAELSILYIRNKV